MIFANFVNKMDYIFQQDNGMFTEESDESDEDSLEMEAVLNDEIHLYADHHHFEEHERTDEETPGVGEEDMAHESVHGNEVEASQQEESAPEENDEPVVFILNNIRPLSRPPLEDQWIYEDHEKFMRGE